MTYNSPYKTPNAYTYEEVVDRELYLEVSDRLDIVREDLFRAREEIEKLKHDLEVACRERSNALETLAFHTDRSQRQLRRAREASRRKRKNGSYPDLNLRSQHFKEQQRKEEEDRK